MSMEKLGQYLGAIEDPRCGGKVEHRLLDILVIAVCAVIACAESWEDIALYGRPQQAGLAQHLPRFAERRPLARHLPARVHADRPRRLRGRVRGLGRLARLRLRARGGGHRWQDDPAFVRPQARAIAAARGQRLGQRAGPRAGPARGGGHVQRDRGGARVAGPVGPGEQHRDAGRHGLPDRDRREDPGARGRLPAHAQGQPSAGARGRGRALRRALLWPRCALPCGLRRLR
jgi:hypothetical protein